MGSATSTGLSNRVGSALSPSSSSSVASTGASAWSGWWTPPVWSGSPAWSGSLGRSGWSAVVGPVAVGPAVGSAAGAGAGPAGGADAGAGLVPGAVSVPESGSGVARAVAPRDERGSARVVGRGVLVVPVASALVSCRSPATAITRQPPWRLAWYMAASARESTSLGDSWGRSDTTPTERVTPLESTAGKSTTASTARSSAASAAGRVAPGNSTTNSSPP